MKRTGPRLQWSCNAALTLLAALPGIASSQTQNDPLPSWNSGSAKQAIVSFVKETTSQSSRMYVEPGDRIATFDQDGTLWTEHPMYAQGMFALERVGKLAGEHPEWKTKPPFQSILGRDQEAISKLTERDWMQIVAATHAGMSTEAFHALVKKWLDTAKDPRFGRPYTDLTYRPMLEVMRYLRANGFKTYIVTGGDRSSCAFTANRFTAFRRSRLWDRAS